LMAASAADTDEALDLQSLFGQADRRAVVHQAAGVLAERNGCTVADALALIRAHAFAEGEPVESIASDIIQHRRRLI
jgi:AmiR/NasT family two-component response regulator